jgi:hypothetical protein
LQGGQVGPHCGGQSYGAISHFLLLILKNEYGKFFPARMSYRAHNPFSAVLSRTLGRTANYFENFFSTTALPIRWHFVLSIKGLGIVQQAPHGLL